MMYQTSSFPRPLCGLLIAGLTTSGGRSRGWARAVAIRGGRMLWLTGGGWLMSAFGPGAF